MHSRRDCGKGGNEEDLLVSGDLFMSLASALIADSSYLHMCLQIIF
jgi:hypothetical protein